MATTLITSLAAVRFTSDIPDLVFSTDSTSIEVEVSVQREVILHETYYSYGGIVTVRDIRSVVEQEMRAGGMQYAETTVNAGPAIASMKVVFCSMNLDGIPQSALMNVFLTTLYSRTMPREQHATDYLHFFASAGSTSDMVAHISFIKPGNALPGVQSIPLGTVSADADGVQTVAFKYDSIVKFLPEGSRLLLATVEIGLRSMTYYFTDVRPDIILLFRNAFNCHEVVPVTGITTAKSKADRSVAVIGGMSRFYDQTDTRTYETETAPLPMEQARWMEQLVLSHDVKMVNGYVDIEDDDFAALPDVLITDATCEIQDGDEELNRIKLTWQYADPRPRIALRGEGIDGGNIFSDEFSNSFT